MADHVATCEAEGLSFRPIPSSKAFYVVAQHEDRGKVAVLDLAISPKHPLVGTGTWPSARLAVADGEVLALTVRPWSVRSPLAVQVYSDFLAALSDWTDRMQEATKSDGGAA